MKKDFEYYIEMSKAEAYNKNAEMIDSRDINKIKEQLTEILNSYYGQVTGYRGNWEAINKEHVGKILKAFNK